MTVSIQLVRLGEASRCVGRGSPTSSRSGVMCDAPPICSSKKAECNGRASAGGAHRRKGVPVQSDELLHGHRWLAGDFGDDLVFAREDAALIIEGDGAEMLDHDLWKAGLLETLPILGNGQRAIGDLAAQHFADGRGDAGLILLDRAMKRVRLAQMRDRLREDGRDEPSLVLRRDRSMASLAIRQIDDAFFDNGRARTGIEQPLREERRTEMHDRNARPVKDTFGDPVIARRVALGILPGGYLRQVDNGLQTCPLGSVREVGRRLDEPGADRIAEIGGGCTGRRSDGVVMLQQVADYDLRACASQRIGTLVFPVDQRADGMPLLHKTLDRVAAGLAGCCGYQDFFCAHRLLLRPVSRLRWQRGELPESGGSGYWPPSARALRIAAQIFCGVSGISRCAIPNGASASRTACTIIGGAPIAPLSPIPFTPSGFVGDGVSWNCERILGSESACGTA